MKLNTENFCHVQERALERYGIVITISEIREMTQEILSGRAEMYWQKSNVAVVYKMNVQGETLYPLYSKKIGYIKTIYTKNMIKKQKQKKRRAERIRKRHGF